MSFSNLLLCCGLVLLVAAPVSAVTVASDDFTHPDGDLVGNTPSPGPGSAWSNHSGSGSLIQVASGEAVLMHGGGSREDAGTNFAAKSGGVLTATFDITVDDDLVIGDTGDPNNPGTDFEYFAHFMQQFNFNFRARTFVTAPNDPNSGDYTLGISSGAAPFEAALPTDYTFGDVVGVSISFDINAGTASLTVGGDTVGAPTVFAGETLDRFGLRQSNSTNDETITVDNLVVTHIPEPASLVLMFAGLAGMVSRRRL